MNKEKFLQTCNEIFKDNIKNYSYQIEEYGSGVMEKQAYEIAEKEFTDKFLILFDELVNG